MLCSTLQLKEAPQSALVLTADLVDAPGIFDAIPRPLMSVCFDDAPFRIYTGGVEAKLWSPRA
jgi:hypothetical protein